MNSVVPISRDDERLEAASRWILKIDEGSLSEADSAALDEWLNEDSRHREVLLEVAAVWDKTDALANLADLFPHEAIDNHAPTEVHRRSRVFGTAIAASLIGLLVSAAMLLPRFEVPTQVAAYETAVGEQKTVLLPDGSEVVLNTNSQLSLTFTASARVLNLTRGEFFVRVAKEHRPFSVVAIDQIVQAKGTEFSVEIMEGQLVEVMVTEGKVVIGIQPKLSIGPDVVDVENTFIEPPVLTQLAENTLSAGEEVILREAEPVKRIVTSDDIEVRLSWKKGRLVFRSEPLENVLREVERYTSVQFVVLDESLNFEVLTGRFRTGDVETLLGLLAENFNINYEYDGENRVLLSSL